MKPNFEPIIITSPPPFCYITIITQNSNGDITIYIVITIIFILFMLVIMSCQHTRAMNAVLSPITPVVSFSFGADEDLRGQNVLLLTSYCHCIVKYSKTLRENSMSLYIPHQIIAILLFYYFAFYTWSQMGRNRSTTVLAQLYTGMSDNVCQTYIG